MPFLIQGKTNWKFLLIVVVLAIVVGGGTLVYLQMTEEEFKMSPIGIPEKEVEEESADLVPSEVEGWLAYRNEEYGFEFKYPAAFDKFEYCKIREEDNFIGLGSRLSILISDVKGLSFSEYIAKEKEKSLYEQTFPPPEEAWHEEDVYIGGIKGIRVTWFHGSRYSQIIYLLKDSTIFRISWTAGPSCLDYYIGQDLLDEDEVKNELYIFEQILNTFKFLD